MDTKVQHSVIPEISGKSQDRCIYRQQAEHLRIGCYQLTNLSLLVMLLEGLIFFRQIHFASMAIWSVLFVAFLFYFRPFDLTSISDEPARSRKRWVCFSGILGAMIATGSVFCFNLITAEQLFVIPMALLVLSACSIPLLAGYFPAIAAFCISTLVIFFLFVMNIGAELPIAWPASWIAADMAILWTAWKHQQAYYSVAFSQKENTPDSIAGSLAHELFRAINNDEFIVYFQPQLNLNTQQVTSIEALVRWEHPEKGLLLPDEFMRQAEQHNLIDEIDQIVLNKSCAQLSLWHDQGLILKLSINVTASQLDQADFAQSIIDVLDTQNIKPEYLELEITENLQLKNKPHIVETLTLLKRRGINISIDDFGTGYSSLSYLKYFPIDVVKIDQSFVVDLAQPDSHDAIIIRAIISASHELGLTVVAEGIEHQNTLNLLKEYRCDFVQGSFISPPVSANQLIGTIHKINQ